MSMPLAPLDQIGAFIAVMEDGSLSGAARQLGRAQPTVRRHIALLEERLDQPLFTRSANGLLPTEAALRLLPLARAVATEAAAFMRAASGAGTGDAITGTVRVTASRILSTHVLPEVFAVLRRTAPGITIELAPDDRVENLLQREADIAVRFAPPEQGAIRARKVALIPVGLFAAPDLAATLPGGARMDDLLAAAPFVWEDRGHLMSEGFRALGLSPPRQQVLQTDDLVAQIGAIAAGIGIGVCQTRIAARLGLTRLCPDWTYDMPTWIAMHEDQARIPRVRRVFDHLVDWFATP